MRRLIAESMAFRCIGAVLFGLSVVSWVAWCQPARPVVFVVMSRPYFKDSTRARIDSTGHAVTRGPSLTGLGKRPDATPAHQQDFLTGMIGGIGGSALELPMICGNRRKPVSGSCFITISTCPRKTIAGRQVHHRSGLDSAISKKSADFGRIFSLV